MLLSTIKLIQEKVFLSRMVKNLLQKSPLMQNAYDTFLRTLSNKTRLAIIQALRDKPKNVTRLTQDLGIHQTSVSHSLKRLLDCGFLGVEKKGQERIYSLTQKPIKPLVRLMKEHINTYCKKRGGDETSLSVFTLISFSYYFCWFFFDLCVIKTIYFYNNIIIRS